MMRKPHWCPVCADELCLYRAVDNWTVFCVECGWRISQPIVAGVDIDTQIADAVAKAKEPDPPHGYYPGTNPAYVPDTDADEGGA